MIFLPVAEREAREASRQKGTFLWRWVIAAIALLVMSFAYFMLRHGRGGGSDLFYTVATVAFLYCLFGGALRTADSIAEEKRENTLGLLFLTDLKTFDILTGKLLTSSVNCVFGLVAMVPILAIPMLMGGVSGAQFGAVILALLNTLFLSMTWGFLISTLFRGAAATAAAASLTALFWGLGILLLMVLLEEEFRARKLAELVFLFSPVDQLVSAFKNRPQYWVTVLVNHLLAWAHLGLALFCLPRFWQETPKNKRAERVRNFFRELKFGKGAQKKKFRARLLGQNPIYWLAHREQISSGGLLILIALALGIGLLIGFAIMNERPSQMDEAGIIFIVSLLFAHAFIAFRVAGAASYKLAEDRKSGGLELILATSISIRDVLRGHWKALARQFFGPVLIIQLGQLFALSLVVMMWMRHQSHVHSIPQAFWTMISNPLDFSGPSNGMGMVLIIAMTIGIGLTLNWMALSWVGMWLGLRFKSAAVAMWATLALVMVPPPALFIASVIAIVESGAMRGVSEKVGVPAFYTYAAVLWLGNIILLTRWARRNVYARFREAASDRFSATRFAVPWRGMMRLAAKAAVLLIVLWGAYVIFRARTNKSGERVWAAALAKHKDFNLARAPQPLVLAAENLAKGPTLLSLHQGNVNLPGPARNANIWMFYRHNTGDLPWNWTIGDRTDFKALEQAFLDSRAITATSSTPAASVIDAFTRKYSKILEGLHAEAADRPKIQFPPDDSDTPSHWYQTGAESYHVAASMLAVRALARNETGAKSLDDIRLGLRIGKGVLDSDPRHLFGGCETILKLIQPIFESIATEKLTDSELLGLQNFFAGIDIVPMLDVYRQDWIRHQIHAGETLIRRRLTGQDDLLFGGQLPTGFVRRNQAQIMDFGRNEMAECLNLTNKTINPQAVRDLLGKRPRTYADEYSSFETFVNSFRIASFLQTTASQITLACALERYKLNTGAYPKSLEPLYPRFIGEIPRDVFTGIPLTYELAADNTYRIWSPGWDGRDHKGASAPTMNSYSFWNESEFKADWVWHSRPRVFTPVERRRR